MVKRLLLSLLVSGLNYGFSQSSFIPLNHDSEHFLDRIEVRTGRLSNEFHSGVRPFSRQAVSQYLAGLNSGEYYNLSYTDRQNVDFLKQDNWEFFDEDSLYTIQKPLLKFFFRQKSDFVHYKNEDFDVHASPVLSLYQGSGSAYGDLDKRSVFNNTRGVEIRARINQKIGFYTLLTDNITSPDNYRVNYFNQYLAFPYESFIKIADDDSTRLRLNYFQALGYFTFKPVKSLQLTFGHDKSFIGSGVRSLILSDFSAPYLQLRLDLKLGRFQYQNIFGQMTNRQVETVPFSQETHRPKYMAFHHLNANITKNLNIGIFESVMFGNRKIGFDPNYINPVIFYRFIEGYLGSSDNAIVGADFKWNLWKTVGLYGQYILDEFNKKEFKKDKWWARKYGWQLGIKYFDALGVSGLDLQAEHNQVRPYTYSHFTTYSNFVNYNLPVAHPLGANFTENIAIIRYQPTQKLQIRLTGSIATKGMDTDSTNYGGDIKKINIENRPRDYGVEQGQGFKNRISFLETRISYSVWHNINADVIYRIRKDSFVKDAQENIFTVGLRWNFPYRDYMF
ncbi:MAG: capsule assembly Wzi family protein [Leadbetterella sp.]|nr:capsule assembly Wzi family protein [Leadbetterella sp.]